MSGTPNIFSSPPLLLWLLTALSGVAILAGCATHPRTSEHDANKPDTVLQATSPAPAAALPTGFTQRLDTKLNIQFDWWKLLQSPRLNTLIEQVFAAHPTTDAAQATLLKAQQDDVVRAGYFHFSASVNEAANGIGQAVSVQPQTELRNAQFIGDSYYDFHARQLTTGYLPEMLRTDKTASAKVSSEMRYLQLEATYRTLASNFIACAIQEASLRAQMLAARKITAIEQNRLAIARKRFNVALATQVEVSTQQASAQQAEQALLSLKSQFEQTRELLHLMLGIAPDADLPETPDLATLHFSEELPLELPAALIEQRPDARAAQLDMQPGNTKHQTTTAAALKNVEDILLIIHNDGIALKAAIAAEQDAQATLESTRKQYAAKEAIYQDMLDADKNDLLTVLRLAQARANYLGDAITLYHAVGGAWWNMNDALQLQFAHELERH